MKYTSNRTFQLWAYSVSHSFLLLRSKMSFEEDENYHESRNFNIDIEFSSVVYIDLPQVLKGVSIFSVVTDLPPKLDQYLKFDGYKFFKIVSGDIEYYIVSGGMIIGKSHWLNEHRISNPELQYDKVLWSS